MPARLADIERAARAMGADVELPSKGSHWKIRFNGTMYPVPAHNGLRSEIGETYIRGLCKAFGWDEATFRKYL
jgi:hypothetical protein